MRVSLGRHCECQEQRYEGSGDAVVESALHVKRPSDADRYVRVVENSLTQSSIRRRKDCGQEGTEGEPLGPIESESDGSSEKDRKR